MLGKRTMKMEGNHDYAHTIERKRSAFVSVSLKEMKGDVSTVE